MAVLDDIVRFWSTEGARHGLRQLMTLGTAWEKLLSAKTPLAADDPMRLLAAGAASLLRGSTRYRTADVLAPFVRRHRPDRILDVGCSFGADLFALRHRCPAHLVGIDVSLDALRLGASLGRTRPGRTISLLGGSVFALPVRSRSADLVLTTGVLSLFPPEGVTEAFREILRVARRWLIHYEFHDAEAPGRVSTDSGYTLHSHAYDRIYRDCAPDFRPMEIRPDGACTWFVFERTPA